MHLVLLKNLNIVPEKMLVVKLEMVLVFLFK